MTSAGGSTGAADLRPLEIATGVVLGESAVLPAGDRISSLDPPLAALERAIDPLLRARPCLVSFSGGRDSALVLAVAASIARRTGQPPPIPITLRFPGDPLASEVEWQERAVSALDIEDWVRIDLTTELDLLGELALTVRRRHGLQFPPNAHFHVPMLEPARGGTLITGNGGDELFGEWRGRAAADLLARRAGPSRLGFLALTRAVAPPALRRASSGRRMTTWLKMPWLSAEGIRRQAAALVHERAAEPSLWRARIAWRARRRWRALTNASLQRIADDYSVQMAHPLIDPGFVRALAVDGGRLGYGTRTETTRALFGSLLPEALVERETKAWFDDVFWGPASRAFAHDWDGHLDDPELAALVAPDAVRSGWLAPIPDARMMLLLQAAHRASG